MSYSSKMMPLFTLATYEKNLNIRYRFFFFLQVFNLFFSSILIWKYKLLRQAVFLNMDLPYLIL